MPIRHTGHNRQVPAGENRGGSAMTRRQFVERLTGGAVVAAAVGTGVAWWLKVIAPDHARSVALSATATAADGAPEAGNVAPVVPEAVREAVHRGVGVIEVFLKGGSKNTGTGWLAKSPGGQVYVVSAAHLLTNEGDKEAIQFMRFSQPFAPLDEEGVYVTWGQDDIQVPQSDDVRTDFGVFRIEDSTAAALYGQRALPYAADVKPAVGSSVFIAGYPEEFAPYYALDESTLYEATGPVSNVYPDDGGVFEAKIYEDEGASGAPVLANVRGVWSAIGVLSGIPTFKPDVVAVAPLTDEFQQLMS